MELAQTAENNLKRNGNPNPNKGRDILVMAQGFRARIREWLSMAMEELEKDTTLTAQEKVIRGTLLVSSAIGDPATKKQLLTQLLKVYKMDGAEGLAPNLAQSKKVDLNGMGTRNGMAGEQMKNK